MPHCTSRASAMTREPVIKMFTWTSGWKELRTEETSVEGYKVRTSTDRWSLKQLSSSALWSQSQALNFRFMLHLTVRVHSNAALIFVWIQDLKLVQASVTRRAGSSSSRATRRTTCTSRVAAARLRQTSTRVSSFRPTAARSGAGRTSSCRCATKTCFLKKQCRFLSVDQDLEAVYASVLNQFHVAVLLAN